MSFALLLVTDNNLSGISIFKKMFICLLLRERERERDSGGGAEREREREREGDRESQA